MNITLINPPPEQAIEYWDKPNFPNVNLAYLAGYLEKKGIICSIIDAKLERLSNIQIIERCKDADLVGITSLTHEIHLSTNLADEIKKAYPKVKMVIGGVHSTALPRETMEEFKAFDYLIYGDGEETFFELIEALKNNKRLDKIRGLVFKKDNNIIINSPREFLQDLDYMPAWHLFPLDLAKECFIITSRGCPSNCNFCMHMHGHKIRYRDVENVMSEIDLLVNKYNIKYIYFADETFTLNKLRIKEICDKIINRKIYFKWSAETRVTCVDLEVLKKMKAAGCHLIRFGIESGNPEILKASKKGITLEQVKYAVNLAKEAGLDTEGMFILGHPNETRETMKDTINFATKLNTTSVAFGIMTPYPKTEIFDIAKRGEGGYKLISTDWKDYNKQIGNALEFTNIPRKEIEKIQFLGYMKFYFYNFKIKEIFQKFIFNYRLIFSMIKKVI